jgi:DNA-binding MurR/RpiR family transcriptional regulator
MIRARGGHTIAIVNRRDSDITFKVDGVFYKSNARDIEMSVASTKAFYSQIVAGALLGLYMANLLNRRSKQFITREIQELIGLPDDMRKILSQTSTYEASANKLSVSQPYWAVVGSGHNKAAADEIRIKLSELCYKTISSDYVEDKKHIDLSSEPLIIICAAGAKEHVIGDIIKDTAIFKAHKAIPIVIADEGEDRFAPYADDVFYVPHVSHHLAPILNTFVGHLWGYYAALAINEGSRFLYNIREEIKSMVDGFSNDGLDVYEIVLEKSFREKIAEFYQKFTSKRALRKLPVQIGLDAACDLTLLFKYLSGKLPVSDFELDFGKKGNAYNILNDLFNCLGRCINSMARPVDAIKHQAKTVTVGTSRISEKIDGILFDALRHMEFTFSQITNRNIMVLKNLQGIIDQIKDETLYRIEGLSVLGEPIDDSTIEFIKRKHNGKVTTSVDQQKKRLKGTNKIVIRQANVYIGKVRKDARNIILIPILTSSIDYPGNIEYLLELEVTFKEDVPLSVTIKALGGKYEHIKNIIQENSIRWNDNLLDRVEIDQLFGFSAENISDLILKSIQPKSFDDDRSSEYAVENDYESKFIRRSIQFPPEYYQAGVSILNYFGTVLKKKYPDQLATVRIEQEGKKVTMVIDPLEGDKEIIEQALDDYGLVITGQLPPEKYSKDRGLITELKYELKLAEARIETQKELLQYQRTDIVELKTLIQTALSNPTHIQIESKAFSNLESDINLKNNIVTFIPQIRESLNEIQYALANGSDEELFIKQLKKDLDKIKYSQSQDEESVASTISEIKDLIINLGDDDSTLGKTIKGIKRGAKIANDLAVNYNKIAQWCGLPQVPEPLLKK